MKANEGKIQVYSKHLVGKSTQEHLARFNEFLSSTMGTEEKKPGAIDDILVLEVSEANFAAIIASSMLAEFGAETIKIEPDAGDPARKITPKGVNVGGTGLPFLTENRNKYFITLDLDSNDGQRRFIKLARKADVIIDAVKPGLMDSRGIGYRQLSRLNPGLIYTAISAYGHFLDKGRQNCNVADTDLTAQAGSGYPNIIGDPSAPDPYNYPTRAGLWAAWATSAMLAASSTMTALLHKRNTGQGQFIDIATADAICTWQTMQVGWGFAFEKPRVRVGRFDWALYPFGFYQAKDGNVTLLAGNDQDFRGLIKILKRWDLENDWRHVLDRVTDNLDQVKQLDDEIVKEVSKYPRKQLVDKITAYSARAAKDKLRGKGMPMAVQTLTPQEVLKEEHWQVRKSFTEVELDNGKKLLTGSPVPKMSETPPVVKWFRQDIGHDNGFVSKKYELAED